MVEQAEASLFPDIEPHRTGMLAVSPIHTIFWEECGSPAGQPVLFVHGGPGSGSLPVNRRYFDPAFYRIILMDQRGSGRSTPQASLEDNTTWHLVADLEALRKHLGVDQWLVFGGSWGSTLSLAYAITHPSSNDNVDIYAVCSMTQDLSATVVGLVLRGVFTLRKKEVDWFYQSGANFIFPDAFEPYRSFVPEDERHDLVAAYNKRLTDDSDPELQMAAAAQWAAWETKTSYLLQTPQTLKRFDEKSPLAFARIENHYFFNKGFFPVDGHLLQNVDKIRHIPCIIIQGRYDIVCPFETAWDLHKAWPEAEFKVVATAGHSANEPGIASELVRATEKFKAILTQSS